MGTIVIDDKYEECRKKLKENLNAKRYIHSIGVSNTAACLAMRYGYDHKKAYLAGLLHDCAKGLKDVQLLETVRQAGIVLSDVEEANPDLLHSKAGSIVAREKYGIDDEEIQGAIYHHTTGRPGMTLLEKIIFVADYIEPNRTNLPGLDRIRVTAFTDIDESIALICKNTLDHLKTSAKAIDRNTVATYEYYRKE